jgi:hypothetical protein
MVSGVYNVMLPLCSGRFYSYCCAIAGGDGRRGVGRKATEGGAVAGSGWRAVGDDLEMDEFGNMYTTGGNAAPGNGGGIFTSGFAGGGGRRGGGVKGKATEAQTW